MAALEERVAYIEGKVEEQALLLKLDALDEKLDQRTFAVVRELHERADTLDQTLSRLFVWLAAAQLTTLLVVVGAIVAAVVAR